MEFVNSLNNDTEVTNVFYEASKKKLKEIAFHGNARVVSEGNWLFGNGHGYVGEVLNNPTYADLLIEAQNLLETTGDNHHRYFEDGCVRISMHQPELHYRGDVTHLNIYMGS